jgi:hypothetical protein
VEQEPTHRQTVTDEDTKAALLALTQTREIHRVLITLLRVGEIRAVYEGAADPSARRCVEHYKFYKPDTEHQEAAALSPEELQSYRAYDDAMTATSLQTLCETAERLRQAHTDVRLPEHECDVADWPAVIKQIGTIDDACDDLTSTFIDEFLPHLEALRQLAHVRFRKVTLLDTAVAMAAAPSHES